MQVSALVAHAKRVVPYAPLVLGLWLAAVTAVECARSMAPSGRGFSSGGGGMVLNGGGGLSKVSTNSPGLLAGSGTTGNPLTATLSVTSPVSGTGSSGSPLTSSGDISGVTAGSGLSGGGTSGAVTLDVGAGSGLTSSADEIDVGCGSGITCGADALTANLGTGLTFSSGAIVPNLAGGTCSNGQGVTSLSSAGTATCGTVGLNSYSGTHFEWRDELFSPPLANNGTYPWWINNITNGTFAQNGTTTRPGLWNVSTSTNSTGLAVMRTDVDSIDFASGTWVTEATMGWPTLSTSSEEYTTTFGFIDTTSGVNQLDGCYFLYDRGNVATGGPNSGNADKLSCWCAQNNNRTKYLMDGSTVSDESFTTVDAPVAALTLPSTNIYRLKVQMTGTTRAEFYVDSGSGYTKRCDINQNIPSGSSRLTAWGLMQLKSAGTTARVVTVDQISLQVDLNSARSP